MLNLHIDDPELEKSIKQDVGISIEQLDLGESLPLNEVMDDIRAKHE